VFGVWPEEKYKRGSAKNIAEVIGIEAGDEAAA
jgi:serine/threonine-protein kinase HipA